MKNERRVNKYKKLGFEVFESSIPHTWIAKKENAVWMWTCFGDILSKPIFTTI